LLAMRRADNRKSKATKNRIQDGMFCLLRGKGCSWWNKPPCISSCPGREGGGKHNKKKKTQKKKKGRGTWVPRGRKRDVRAIRKRARVCEMLGGGGRGALKECSQKMGGAKKEGMLEANAANYKRLRDLFDRGGEKGETGNGSGWQRKK